MEFNLSASIKKFSDLMKLLGPRKLLEILPAGSTEFRYNLRRSSNGSSSAIPVTLIAAGLCMPWLQVLIGLHLQAATVPPTDYKVVGISVAIITTIALLAAVIIGGLPVPGLQRLPSFVITDDRVQFVDESDYILAEGLCNEVHVIKRLYSPEFGYPLTLNGVEFTVYDKIEAQKELYCKLGIPMPQFKKFDWKKDDRRTSWQ